MGRVPPAAVAPAAQAPLASVCGSRVALPRCASKTIFKTAAHAPSSGVSAAAAAGWLQQQRVAAAPCRFLILAAMAARSAVSAAIVALPQRCSKRCGRAKLLSVARPDHYLLAFLQCSYAEFRHVNVLCNCIHDYTVPCAFI